MTEGIEWEPRFRNWVRWCLSKPRLQGHCGSIEHRYKSPQADVWDPPEPRSPAIDVRDAIEVNRAYLTLPRSYQRTIKVIYFCSHWRASWQAQKIGCRVVDLAERAYRAKTALKNLLHLQHSETRVTTDSLGRYGTTVNQRLPHGAALSL